MANLQSRVDSLELKVDVLDTEKKENESYIVDNKIKRKQVIKTIKTAVIGSILASSVHGYPNIFKSNRLVAQIMWAFFFALSCIICAW
jgi:hypothetical protein